MDKTKQIAEDIFDIIADTKFRKKSGERMSGFLSDKEIEIDYDKCSIRILRNGLVKYSIIVVRVNQIKLPRKIK